MNITLYGPGTTIRYRGISATINSGSITVDVDRERLERIMMDDNTDTNGTRYKQYVGDYFNGTRSHISNEICDKVVRLTLTEFGDTLAGAVRAVTKLIDGYLDVPYLEN